MNIDLLILVILITIIGFNFSNSLTYLQKISVVNKTICPTNPAVFYGHTIQFFGAGMPGQNFMATTYGNTFAPNPTDGTNDYRAINITAIFLMFRTTGRSFLTATVRSNKFLPTKH